MRLSRVASCAAAAGSAAALSAAVLSAAVVPAAAADPPWFTDVSTEAGLAGQMAFRLSVADVDGDGYPDIFLHRTQNEDTGDVLNKQYLLLNRPGAVPGSRVFVDATAASGIRANRQGTADGRHSDGAVFADVDNDGDLDCFTMVYVHRNTTLDKGRNDLLLNDGQGHFTLAPNSPFHTDPIWNTAAAVFLDYDNDGNVDLFLGNWYWNDQLTLDRLYRGLGDGRFVDATVSSGISAATTSVYGVAAADWNNDGYTDLFAASYAWTVLNAYSRHWRNNGDGTFTQVQNQTKYSQYTGTASTRASFGSMPRDYDDDGDIDLFEILTHGDASVYSTVLTNTNGVFSWDFFRVKNRATEDPDMTHHGDHYQSWFDVDNDGLADYALTESGYGNNRLYIFMQAPDRTFSPATVAAGLDPINVANLPPHNVIPLDYDLDGDEDLLVGFADDVNHVELWRNDVGARKRWITVTLRGAGIAGHANRAAVGARVELTAGGRTWTREVAAGNGHMGPQAPLALTFGLGDATAVDRIRVRWPNAGRTWSEVTNLAANQFVVIDEPCPRADDPAGLLVAQAGVDVRLAWDDPAVPGLAWNVHRGTGPDRQGWGPPIAQRVGDADPGEPGIQYTDAGAAGNTATYFYLVGAVNACGESAPW